MNIPLFLQNEFQEVKLTNNEFQKFHKLVHFNLKIMKYISIILYIDAASSDYKNNKAEKILANKFQTPTEGQWLSLLEQIISSRGKNYNSKKEFRKKIREDLIRDFSLGYSIIIDDDRYHQENLNFFEYFAKIISIKNKRISHGIISEDKASLINKKIFPITEYMIRELEPILCAPLIHVNEDSSGDISLTEIHNCQNYDNSCDDIEAGLNVILNNNAYSLYPFLICRDGSVYFYNNFDRKNLKIFYTGAVGKETYKKTSSIDICELFKLDKESLFIKPLENRVITTRKGITHNLPQTDYSTFVGRKSEFSELEKMICHKRHFLSALDGIGGVGKTALAQHYCERVAIDESYLTDNFEFIIWLSSKTTRLENGKIKNIKQSFEHLDQLLDTTLDVLGFSEYKPFDIEHKKMLVNELLESAKCLIVLDNLETLSGNNLNEIWSYISDIPDPSKALFTSREYSFDIPQILRIDSLSSEDAESFVDGILVDFNSDIDVDLGTKRKIIELSSGLPIALKSIVGQYMFGKSIRSIESGIRNNTDDLSKFCFQEQLKKLDDDHLKVIILNSLSIQELSEDSMSFILGDLIIGDLNKIVSDIRSLSIIKMTRTDNETTYSMLPMIKDYVLSLKKTSEHLDEIRKRLNDFYSLNETDSYTLMPIEERSIRKGSLMPRKLVDRAMKHAENDELEEAEINFNNCLKKYPDEGYVWYVYSLFQSQYMSKIEDAIVSLKHAISIEENYIYYKKIGDLHIKIKNYDAAIKYYRTAENRSEIEQNKSEMEYLIGNAHFMRVKSLRRQIKLKRSKDLIQERNSSYASIISLFEKYLENQPSIYDGKKIKIYRMLAESYFGLSDKDNSLNYIEKAIDLSEYDDRHVEYRHFILDRFSTI